MIKISKREGTLLIVLIIALCGGLYYNFVLKPYQVKRDEIDIKIAEVKSTLSDTKLKKATITIINGKIKLIEDDMGLKLTGVLDSIDRPAIIVMLDKILAPAATNTNLGFSQTYQDLKSNFITTVDVSFECTQDGFNQILNALRTANYINRVVTSSIRVSNPQTGACEASISIEIITSSITPTKTEFNY